MIGHGINLLLGPMLVGVFFNCILYGVLVVQTLVYYQTFKNRDPTWFKMFVAYLMFCETVNTACTIYLIYQPLIVLYGTDEAVKNSPLMLPSVPVTTVLVAAPVQIFIAWRVRVTSKSWIVPSIIVLFASAAFIGGVATAISCGIINKYADFHKFDAAVTTWLGSTAAADILVTGSLVYSLSRQRTGFAATDDVINRVIRMTVQTGMITSVFAILDLAMFDTFSGTTLNFIWDLALSKLYSNSLLSTLNARGGWKATGTLQSNILFGDGSDGDSVPTRSRAQIEFVTRKSTNGAPVKGFGTEAGFDATTTYAKKFVQVEVHEDA